MNPIRINSWAKENKKAIFFWCFLVILSFVFTFFQTTNRTKDKKQKTKSVDTYIPEGLVLLPIELSNSSSLDGLLESKGVVDLYTTNPTKISAEKVAMAVKIIRSPNNYNHFAVLVPEKQASWLIKRFQAFYAVIQNPRKAGTKIQPLKRKIKRSIVIELDGPEAF